jgi:hypothetical protein
MTTQTLTPVQDVTDGAGLDITAQLITPSATTLLFSNTGREKLIVVAGASSETVTVDVGALVDGQPVQNFSPVTVTSAHYVQFGPFHSVIDQSGTNEVQVVLSTNTSIQVALIQDAGVF